VSTDERIVVGVSGSAALRWLPRRRASAARRSGQSTPGRRRWIVAPYAPQRGVPSSDHQRQASAALLTAAISHAFGSRSDEHGIGVRPILLTGQPVAVSLRYAAGADLLVLGRRRRPEHLDGIALGAVARTCVAKARCPTVVVAAEEIVDDTETSSPSEWHLCRAMTTQEKLPQEEATDS
jgi:nucleotide-binding universal stress UspA family protein